MIAPVENLNALVQATVEHPFQVIKCQFGHVKMHFRELMTTTAQLKNMFALSNLWMAQYWLLGTTGGTRPGAAMTPARGRRQGSKIVRERVSPARIPR
jgi:hypothetical protein